MSIDYTEGDIVEVRIRKDRFDRIMRGAEPQHIHVFQSMLTESRQGEVCLIRADHKQRGERSQVDVQGVNIEITPNVSKPLCLTCLHVLRVLEPA